MKEKDFFERNLSFREKEISKYIYAYESAYTTYPMGLEKVPDDLINHLRIALQLLNDVLWLDKQAVLASHIPNVKRLFKRLHMQAYDFQTHLKLLEKIEPVKLAYPERTEADCARMLQDYHMVGMEIRVKLHKNLLRLALHPVTAATFHETLGTSAILEIFNAIAKYGTRRQQFRLAWTLTSPTSEQKIAYAVLLNDVPEQLKDARVNAMDDEKFKNLLSLSIAAMIAANFGRLRSKQKELLPLPATNALHL